MMIKRIQLLFLLSLFVLVNCTSNLNKHDYSLPYFDFKGEDRENLLVLPVLNKRLVFTNQSNEELLFDVIKSEEGMQLYSRGSFVYGSTKYYYYDEQQLFLRSTLFGLDARSYYLEVSVSKRPLVFDWSVYPISISEESELAASIEYSPFNNTGQNVSTSYNNTFNMIINGKTYSKVIKINITSTSAFNPNWRLPSINYFYLDINHGIIGFDDKDGNEWRLE